jgi:hypothetical protein
LREKECSKRVVDPDIFNLLVIVLAAGSMSENTPNPTENTPNTPPHAQPEPLAIAPLTFLPPNVSYIRLAQPYSASSSNPLGKIPTKEELLEELEGQARMAKKLGKRR